MGVADRPSYEPDRTVNVRALWAGGAASAVVAALAAFVGVLVCQDVLDLQMAPPPLLPIGWSLSVEYALTSAVLALAATGLAHLLFLTTPRPETFFSWIVGLATVVGVAISFASPGPLSGRFATAVVNLIVGMCILVLVRSVLERATERELPGPWRAPEGYGPISPPPDIQ